MHSGFKRKKNKNKFKVGVYITAFAVQGCNPNFKNSDWNINKSHLKDALRFWKKSSFCPTYYIYN